MVPEYEDFRISFSKDTHDQITEISPDIAVCGECLSDMETDPTRISYPFVNCTDCGPRFTIIEGLPYDRSRTSMKEFDLCDKCRTEYNNIFDRRFHAQPVACNNCGPGYLYFNGTKTVAGTVNILKALSLQIDRGHSVAVKGTGGYHLMCDALNNDAVSELRKNKKRDAKPFAVMFKDLIEVKNYCHVSEAEEKELVSWRRPVVILREKKPLAYLVSNGLRTTGAMLPYMPFHHLMFRYLSTGVVVLTSGNLSDEPVVAHDDEAMKTLFPVTGSLISYNRQILNRVDDSVIRIANDRPIIIRRSRGYTPAPVDVRIRTEGIFAAGAGQKNSFCIGRNSQAVMSQYIGDLTNMASCEFYRESFERLSDLFRFRPALVAADLHPDYYSSVFASDLAEKLKIPLLKVQHHHAHVVSCMAEHDLYENVIGVSFDGTGYGSDGNIWGGEFMVADTAGFSRYTHFDYVPMPGGDMAIREPWRMAFSYITKYFGPRFDYESLPLFRNIGRNKMELMNFMLSENINCPLSSGAGRLFDAVSALLGLCSVASFDSEAPVRLESVIDCSSDEYYPYTAGKTIEFGETLRSIISDMDHQDVSLISAKFHNTVARVILEVADKIRYEKDLSKVVLSGGVFQNSYLLEKSACLLSDNGFEVFTNRMVPCNDGGISLGQIVIASENSGLCA